VNAVLKTELDDVSQRGVDCRLFLLSQDLQGLRVLVDLCLLEDTDPLVYHVEESEVESFLHHRLDLLLAQLELLAFNQEVDKEVVL